MPKDAIIDVAPVTVQQKTSRVSRKTVALAVGALVLLIAIGIAAWWMLSSPKKDGMPASGTGSASYIEVPAMTVNMRGSDGAAAFLKLRFIIVAADAGKVERIKEQLPVVLDALQPFLRELRPDDLAGSAAVFRIKEEMMARATQSLGAGVVRDVLIQDLLQQ